MLFFVSHILLNTSCFLCSFFFFHYIFLWNWKLIFLSVSHAFPPHLWLLFALSSDASSFLMKNVWYIPAFAFTFLSFLSCLMRTRRMRTDFWNLLCFCAFYTLLDRWGLTVVKMYCRCIMQNSKGSPMLCWLTHSIQFKT